VNNKVIYRQINKDYAYWIEKRRLGQMKGGNVSGLITHLEDGRVKQNILVDAGLGTIEGIADACLDLFWDEPLAIFITHGHIDHHAELMVLAEIYCTRRGTSIEDVRPPLQVYCTMQTQKHLFNTHRWGYTGGQTLRHCLLDPGTAVEIDVFRITPLSVDHFEGAVIFVIDVDDVEGHRILIAWDMTTLPSQHIEQVQSPSLALIEATTWTSQAAQIGHTNIEDLVHSGFLDCLQLKWSPERDVYGAYLVHYSGWEDPGGALPDDQLKLKFDAAFPHLSGLVRVAGRGQQWEFSLSN